jgi:hypothetical protein
LFQKFVDFVMERARVDKASATIRSSTDKAKSPLQGRRSDTMGPFASGHPDASANDRRMQEQRRPRSDDRTSARYVPRSIKWQIARNF